VNDPIADSARAAAERLDSDYGPGLISEVEAALSSQGQEQFFDPVSLGALIVSIATLAWTIYSDLKKTASSPAPDVVARTIRVELRNWGGLSQTSLNQITDVVVTEITETGSGQR
jgi:hypothetical protein